MKKGIALILVGLLVMIAIPVMAEEKSATQLEQLIAKKGEVIIKDSYYIGTIKCYLTDLRSGEKVPTGALKITALVIYQLGTAERLYGLEICIGGETSFLDFEEVESLSKALSYMIELSGEIKKSTEIFFQTKGDFKIGFSTKGLIPIAFSQTGSGIYSAFINMGIEELKNIKELIDKALIELKSLGAE